MKNKIRDNWFFMLSFLDIPSGVIMGLFTLTIIALAVYCVIADKLFPSSIATIYSVAVSGYVVHRTWGIDSPIPTVTTTISSGSGTTSHTIKPGE